MALLTPNWSLDGILFLISLITMAYMYMTRKFNYWKKRNVVEVPPTPFFGSFTDSILLKKGPGHIMKELYNRAKGLPCIGFYIMDKPCLLIRDPELIKTVLVKNFSHFGDRYSKADANDRLGSSNLFLIKNPAWKLLRINLSPIFTSSKLKQMFQLMVDCAKNLDVLLDALKLEGEIQEIDMKEVCAQFTTDMIGTTAYGLNMNSLTNPNAEFRKCGRDIFNYNSFLRCFELLIIFFWPIKIPFYHSKFFGKESSKFLRKVFWESINQRIESGEKRNDLISLLVELKEMHHNEEFDGFKYDGDDLVAQAAIFFTGGFETSSSTISFTLYNLAIHPEIQERLRKEIVDALDKTGGKITYDMVKSLTYLDMVCCETLRMYPILPSLDRLAIKSLEIPEFDLTIEEDTPIYISLLGLHSDPEYFPNPDKFDPERFNEQNKPKIPQFVYLPFGDGPRGCIGLRLGLLQTKLGLIKILKRCKITTSKRTLIPMRLNLKTPTTCTIDSKMYLNLQEIDTNVN